MFDRLRQRFGNVIAKAITGEARNPENPQFPLTSPEAYALLAQGWSDSGANVTLSTAMKHAVVFSCVRVLAETCGQLSQKLYLREGATSRTEQPLNAVATIMRRPNEVQTAMQFKTALTAQAALTGNGYAVIERSRGGQVESLWPMDPETVKPELEAGRLVYNVYGRNGVQKLDPIEVFHLTGFGMNGFKGISVLEAARNSIGLGISAEKFGSRFFKADARPPVVYEIPAHLSKEAKDKVVKSIEKEHEGGDATWRFMVAEDGLKVHTVAMPNDDAQFLETRQFQVNDITRFFRMQPHMIQDLSHATFSNIAELGQEFVTFTMDPWFTAWEQQYQLKFFDSAYEWIVETEVRELLRGNPVQRSQYYRTMFFVGAMSPDEIRAAEGMNPRPDGNGGQFYVPANMDPADQLARQDAIDSANPPELVGVTPEEAPEGSQNG